LIIFTIVVDINGEDKGDGNLVEEEGEEDAGEVKGYDPQKIRDALKNMPGAAPGMFDILADGETAKSPLGYAQRQELFNSQLPPDTPFILCDACKALVRRAYFLVSDRREKFKKSKVSEVQISDMMNNICNPRSEEGKWITEYAVIEPDDLTRENLKKFVLKRMQSVGFCEESCWLVENACQQVIEHAETDLIEQLWLNKLSRDDLVTRVCGEYISELKGSCNKPYPKVSAERKTEERMYSFRKKTEEDLESDTEDEKRRTMGMEL
jgi:hypothetical protein